MDSIRKVFAHRLRERRGELTQDQFAERLGIPKSSLQKMEAGNVPQRETLKHLVDKLGLESETALFLDPDLIRAPKPSPTVESLLGVIQDQERRIRELEARQVAVGGEDPFLARMAKITDPTLRRRVEQIIEIYEESDESAEQTRKVRVSKGK